MLWIDVEKFTLKVFSSISQVAHDIADMAHYSGEQEQGEYELHNSKEIVATAPRIGHLADERHHFGAHVEGFQVLFEQVDLGVVQFRGGGSCGGGGGGDSSYTTAAAARSTGIVYRRRIEERVDACNGGEEFVVWSGGGGGRPRCWRRRRWRWWWCGGGGWSSWYVRVGDVRGFVDEVVGEVARQEVGETRVPVKDGEQIVEHDDGAEEVGKVGVSLGAVEELPEAVDLDEPEAAQDRVVADAQVEYVERYEAQTVDVEARRVHVVVAQPDRVGLEHALFEKTGTKVEENVAYVQKVREVVEREPVELVARVYFVERVAVDHHPEVVEERQRYDEAFYILFVITVIF